MPRFRDQPVDIVIDVRSRLEFWLGHLDGAVCIPHHRIATGIASLGSVGKDSRILLVCASGARSARAADVLRQLGYRCVTDGGALAGARPHFTA